MTDQNRILIISVFIFLFSFFLYSYYAAPCIYWGDDGLLITSSQYLSLGHPPGHPLFMQLVRPVDWLPFGNTAYRYNIMSSFFAACSGLCLFLFLVSVTAGYRGGILAGLFGTSVFLTHEYIWHQSGRGETYALQIFLFGLCLYCLTGVKQVKGIYLGTFLGAMLICNQLLLAAFAGPGLVVLWLLSWKKHRFSGQILVVSILLFLMGLSVYLYLPIRGYIAEGSSWNEILHFGQFWDYATAKEYQSQFYSAGLATSISGAIHRSVRFIPILSHQTLALGFFGGLAGILLGVYKKPEIFIPLVMIVFLTIGGAAGCSTFSAKNWDFQGYLVQAIWILAAGAGLAMGYMIHLLKPNRTLFVLFFLVSVFPLTALVPLSRDQSLREHHFARLFGMLFFDDAPLEGLLISRSDVGFLLGYLKYCEGVREDVQLVSLNTYNRINDKARLQFRFPNIKIPDIGFLVAEKRLPELIRVNSDRVCGLELSDLSLAGSESWLSGPVLQVGGLRQYWHLGRNLEYFLLKSDETAEIAGDYNAVEQVSMILYNRGTLRMKRGDMVGALADLRIAADLMPDNAKFVNNLGVALGQTGDDVKAKACFLRVLEIDKNHPGALYNLKLMEK